MRANGVTRDPACKPQFAAAGTKTVTNGGVPNSDGVTFNAAGTYYWQAIYSGDANNNGATSTCTSEQLVVNPNQPSLSTAQSKPTTNSAAIANDTSTATGTTAIA